ncbi:hypothetical protein ACLOJK_001696 [Asimina triloba]
MSYGIKCQYNLDSDLLPAAKGEIGGPPCWPLDVAAFFFLPLDLEGGICKSQHWKLQRHPRAQRTPRNSSISVVVSSSIAVSVSVSVSVSSSIAVSVSVSVSALVSSSPISVVVSSSPLLHLLRASCSAACKSFLCSDCRRLLSQRCLLLSPSPLPSIPRSKHPIAAISSALVPPSLFSTFLAGLQLFLHVEDSDAELVPQGWGLLILVASLLVNNAEFVILVVTQRHNPMQKENNSKDKFGTARSGLTGGRVRHPDDDWELCNDDGFVYKRRKKQHHESSTVAADSSNPELEAQHRRDRKKKILVGLREQYGREIQQWERLLAALHQLESNTQADASLLPLTAFEKYTPQQIQEGEGGCQPLIIDEILQKVAEAQEAILQELLNLCDLAEASCKTQEENLKQSLIDLPIWASPQTLMASLSEVEDGENGCGNSNNS